MTTTYQKIRGEELTADQYVAVHDSLMDKFGCILPSQMIGHLYWFSGDRFLEVWN